MTLQAAKIRACEGCGASIRVITNSKRCLSCRMERQREKKREQYYKHKDHWPKAEPYAENPAKFRRYHYTYRYGITRKDVEAMHAAQDGGCAICRKTIPLDAPTRALAFNVDHCHATGRVRGLLCRPCNLMLGNASDRADVLRAAISYLESFA